MQSHSIATILGFLFVILLVIIGSDQSYDSLNIL
jgi:hypothetical protein